MTETRNLDEEPVRAVDLDILWTLLGGFIVFMMQAGFAMLEAGNVRRGRTRHILLKNMMDSCGAAAMWWMVGSAFAFAGFEPHEMPRLYAQWVFHFAFAATAATIVSGAVAERCRYQAYFLYTIVITGFIYPVAAHWVWSHDGWLSTKNLDRAFEGSLGLIDYAGSSVVHVTGGCAAFWGAYFLGPRDGRFIDHKPVQFEKNSLELATLGAFILWFGWYPFNAASGLQVRGNMITASLAAVNTTVSAAFGGLTMIVTGHWGYGNPLEITPGLNGILAGLVGITAGCAVVEPFAACITGILSALAYDVFAQFLLWCEIDDPLEASAVHFVPGMLGTILVGLFATETNIKRAFPENFVSGRTAYGLFYGGNVRQLAVQILGTAVIAIWSGVISCCVFWLLNRYEMLRCPGASEEPGEVRAIPSGDASHAVNNDDRSTQQQSIQMRERHSRRTGSYTGGSSTNY